MEIIWKILGKNRLYFIFTLLIGVLYSMISVVIPTVSGKLITAVVYGESNSRNRLFVFIFICVLLILFSQADKWMTGKLQIKQKQLMRKKCFFSFSLNDSAGREEQAAFVSFVNNDIPSITEQYIIGTIDIVKCISIVLLSSISLLSVHWILAFLIIGISGMMVSLPKIIQEKSGNARKVYSGALAKYNTILQSFLGGNQVIKTYRYHERANGLLGDEDKKVVEKEEILLKYQLLMQGLTAFLQESKKILILIIGIILVAQGAIEIGGLVAIIQLENIISAPIEVLAYLFHSRNEVLPLLEHYGKLQAISNVEKTRASVTEVCSNEIQARELSYQIGELQILKNINVTFKAGKNYLITGTSGSGKSTLLRLLARVGDDSYTGNILFDENEIRKISYGQYYENVATVFQEPYLFYASLRENILLGREISDEQYNGIIEKLHLEYLLKRYAEQEITPEIVDSLSGGEKQRVALARAMVGRPQVYLLDEVTSALDVENAHVIERLLLEEDAMVIHISHKVNEELLEMYDEKLKLNNGIISINN